LIGTGLGVGIAFAGGFLIYGVLKSVMGIRLGQEEEFRGADLSIHQISSTPEQESSW
jgi:Amt family ammonium transporter